MTKRVKSRPSKIRCSRCHAETSRLRKTPLDKMRLPQWMFGYALHEAISRHPQVLTISEIARRLGISYNSALLLKRRLQLLASDQMHAVKSLMHKELRGNFRNYNFPKDLDADLTKRTKRKAVPQADAVVLYSASQRANKGRKRHKHGGSTASIYLSDSLGGKQVGTLTQIFSWKKGPILIDSIPDTTMETLMPLLNEYLPKHTPLFTDEGYRFYKGISRNHRMINHSAHAKDSKRNRWSRNRWCKNGVHSQVAEGNGRALKQAFSAYGWINPKYSQLYLDEWSFMRAIKYYGIERIAKESKRLAARKGKVVVRAADALAGNAGNVVKGVHGSDGGKRVRNGGDGTLGTGALNDQQIFSDLPLSLSINR